MTVSRFCSCLKVMQVGMFARHGLHTGQKNYKQNLQRYDVAETVHHTPPTGNLCCYDFRVCVLTLVCW